MKREEIYQHVIRCACVNDMAGARPLYAYAVKRKFPSPEVIYNKAAEIGGNDLPLPLEEQFANIPESGRACFTIFRGVAELLEPFADEPIEAFTIGGQKPVTSDGAIETGAKSDGSAGPTPADAAAAEKGEGEPANPNDPGATLSASPAPSLPEPVSDADSDASQTTAVVDGPLAEGNEGHTGGKADQPADGGDGSGAGPNYVTGDGEDHAVTKRSKK